MRREPPSKSLFSYPVAQTNQDLGRDKGKIRLCFGNCGKKEAMSQCLLSPEKYIAHWGGCGAKPVHVSGGGVGRADRHMGIWREWSWGGGWRGENVNEQEVGKHIGEMVLRVGLWGGRSCQNRSRTSALR